MKLGCEQHLLNAARPWRVSIFHRFESSGSRKCPRLLFFRRSEETKYMFDLHCFHLPYSRETFAPGVQNKCTQTAHTQTGNTIALVSSFLRIPVSPKTDPCASSSDFSEISFLYEFKHFQYLLEIPKHIYKLYPQISNSFNFVQMPEKELPAMSFLEITSLCLSCSYRQVLRMDQTHNWFMMKKMNVGIV